MSRDERTCMIYYSVTETGNACFHLNRHMAFRMNRRMIGQTAWNRFGEGRWKFTES